MSNRIEIPAGSPMQGVVLSYWVERTGSDAETRVASASFELDGVRVPETWGCHTNPGDDTRPTMEGCRWQISPTPGRHTVSATITDTDGTVDTLEPREVEVYRSVDFMLTMSMGERDVTNLNLTGDIHNIGSEPDPNTPGAWRWARGGPGHVVTFTRINADGSKTTVGTAVTDSTGRARIEFFHPARARYVATTTGEYIRPASVTTVGVYQWPPTMFLGRTTLRVGEKTYGRLHQRYPSGARWVLQALRGGRWITVAGPQGTGAALPLSFERAAVFQVRPVLVNNAGVPKIFGKQQSVTVR